MTATKLPFYVRNAAERRALAMDAISEQRTLIERWYSLETKEASDWSQRSAMAAEWLRDVVGVADMGCGTMGLARYLSSDQRYVPVDVVARDDRTVVCDFNIERLPSIPVPAAACLGLLEYIYKPDAFLKDLSGHYQLAVVSYCVADAKDAPDDRLGHAWVNSYTKAEVEDLFSSTGWLVAERRWVDTWQHLWLLRSIQFANAERF